MPLSPAHSPTPWNGAYAATKASLYTLSQVLSMECRPLGIHVAHVAPGAVVSRIAANNARAFALPPTSLYAGWRGAIVRRIWMSQGANAMDTAQFARALVGAVLRPDGRPPPLYLRMGGNTLAWAVLAWVPRAWALWLMWRVVGGKPAKVGSS